MTPDILCYYQGMFAGKRVFIELSTGRGFFDQPIFGVTVRDASGKQVKRADGANLGGCFQRRAEALAYINGGVALWEVAP
jgi:hypothetical protein